MRYITILGSKQHPITKKQKLEKNKILSINEITRELQDGKLCLQLVGNNLEQDSEYSWNIQFDDETIIPTSIGTTLILSKNNTFKYLESNKTSIIVRINDYVSQNFEL